MCASGGVFKLTVIQRRVEAALLHQRFVGAALNDIARLHDEDEVGVFDRREPVGNDKAGAALCQFGKLQTKCYTYYYSK